MCSSLLQLAPGSSVLSKPKQIHKMTTILTQNDNFVHPGQFYFFFLICSALYKNYSRLSLR